MATDIMPKLIILPDHEALSRQAASVVADNLRSAIAARGRSSVAVSGGTTPLKMFELLGTTYKKEISWDLTNIFWVDERCVPPDHKDSNYKGAHDALLYRIDIPPENVHRIKGELLPEEEAKEYEEELKKYFGRPGVPAFDLVVLGIGKDGHTASLFPGSPSLDVKERLALSVYAEHLKSWRITLTIPVLNNALQVLFLVSGREKAGVLKKIIEGGEESRKYPAGLIDPVHGSIIWLAEKKAASLLKIDERSE